MMKTFAEYIKEAVDFRLGGSSNKGPKFSSHYHYNDHDDDKTFDSLKEGDKFFYYNFQICSGKWTDILKLECTFKCIEGCSLFDCEDKSSCIEVSNPSFFNDSIYAWAFKDRKDCIYVITTVEYEDPMDLFKDINKDWIDLQ